jgi:hypothetical protein
MKRIILLALCSLGIVGTVSAYGLYLSCPEEIQAGLPLKCSIDSDFPAGTTFNVAFYQSQYTATLVSKQTLTIQENKNTQYKLFDTQGLPGGSYKVEVQYVGNDEPRLRSDSKTLQLVKVIDRSDEIEITSPLTQSTSEDLRIEGSIAKLGTDGVEIEVRGPDGRIFGPQWIGTTNNIKDSSGEFTKKVTITTAGSYDVDFSDAKGYIGKVTFTVTSPETQVPTTIPATTPVVVKKTTKPVTAVPTPWNTPTPTQSPLSPFTVLCAAGLAGLLVMLARRKAE